MNTSSASDFQTDGQSMEVVQLDTQVFQQPDYTEIQEEHQQLPIKLKTAKDDTCYYMQHDSRGKAVIINFYKFKKKLAERQGSEVDVENLRKAFSHLQFEVIEWNKENNLTVEQLKKNLSDLAVENHTNSDCLVIVAMSHGKNDELYAIDGKFHVQDLWKPFTAGSCFTLAGKPKLFFIQACRGGELEKEVPLRNATERNDDGLYTIPIHSDMLLAYATFQGYVAVREKSGTWFIRALCEELLQNGTKHSLLNLLTSVNRRVAVGCEVRQENTIIKQQPVTVSTLNRKLYFGKKE